MALRRALHFCGDSTRSLASVCSLQISAKMWLNSSNTVIFYGYNGHCYLLFTSNQNWPKINVLRGGRGERRERMEGGVLFNGLKQKIHRCFTGAVRGQFIERTGTGKWHVGAVTDISIGICIRCFKFHYPWMNGLYSHFFNGSCDLRSFMVIDLPFNLISEHAKKKTGSCTC